MSSKLRDQVELELGALRRLVEEHAPFRGRPAGALNNFEVAACGAMLHSFYNGVENILKRIVLTLDGALPGGDAWHKHVLSQMAQPTARSGAALSPQLCEDLKDYLNFRHVFRSAYSFHLRWEKMEPLVTIPRPSPWLERPVGRREAGTPAWQTFRQTTEPAGRVNPARECGLRSPRQQRAGFRLSGSGDEATLPGSESNVRRTQPRVQSMRPRRSESTAATPVNCPTSSLSARLCA